MVISIVLGEVLFPHGLKGISTPVFNDSNCTNNTAGVNKTCTYTKSELSQRLQLSSLQSMQTQIPVVPHRR